MSELTYESIEHLVADKKQTAGRLTVTFTCPETGVSAESFANIAQGKGLKDVAKKSVKRSLFASLRVSVSHAVGSVLGQGVAGRAAREVSHHMMTDAQRQGIYSAGETKAAVVTAFERVSNQFKYDTATGKWLGAAGRAAATAPDSEFAKQLKAAPVVEKYDRGVMARMLTEIACIDGSVSDDEREFLDGFIDPDLGTVDDLAKRDRLSGVELSEVSDKVRDTLLMLAFSVALSDKELADEESVRLAEFAGGLGIQADRADELRKVAGEYLLDQAFALVYVTGVKDAEAHAEAMSLGSGMGLTREETERADVRYRKRAGIV